MKEKPMNGRESSKSPSRSAPALLPSPPPLPILLKELLEEEKINAGRAKGQDAQGRAALLTYLWGSQMAETVRCPSSRGPAVATTVNSPGCCPQQRHEHESGWRYSLDVVTSVIS
ncbi:uncharacterized protein LOC103674926 isoform X7 [Ursus maritimus]|uniref:Uncharacterized protein LOC103674926 isoform X7 n=1 Tax=Ursus maritimus TaxID=29073 RepID=A0A8M1FXF1_URSMA|nr:uncharacterized protein LOC103674926 isoform X7 [Ursus maritimus]